MMLSSATPSCDTLLHPVFERTICQPITATGIGLHGGKQVVLTLSPAKTSTGICFVRTDLDGEPVPLNAYLIKDTMMSSNLISGTARFGTIEHVLSAIAAMGIDNLLIEVSAGEMPIMDGSAAPFMDMLIKAGICEQPTMKQFLKMTAPVQVSEGDKWARLEPYEGGFLMTLEIDFAHTVIKNTPQCFEFQLSSKNFETQLAKARTFGFLSELEQMRANNLALGGSLDNAIVLDDDKVMNEGGLYFPDEFVRHKLLDAVGDLYAIGYPILGRFGGYKSGHALNNRLIRAVLDTPTAYEIVTFYDKVACPLDYYPAHNTPKRAEN